MANSWGESGTTWGQGNWGEQNNFTVSGLRGLSITSGLGTPAAYAEQGWGRATWGSEIWGDSYDPVISVSGFALTTALGTFPYAQSEDGWGRDEWGYGNWGQNTTTVVLTDSFEISSTQGPAGWGEAPWNEQIGWGGDLRFDTTQLSVISLTGIEGTLSLGAPTINYDFKVILTTSLQMSAGIGVPNINNGADHTQGVGSLLATMSLGTPTLELGVPLTGIEATLSLGTATATEAQIIDLTGLEANFYALNIPTVADMAIGVSGYSITGSLGSPSIDDMRVGISGIQMTGELGSGGVSPLYYKDVDITGNTSYTYVKHAGE